MILGRAGRPIYRPQAPGMEIPVLKTKTNFIFTSFYANETITAAIKLTESIQLSNNAFESCRNRTRH
jgi:hypothetical protein